jgi:hypothetical protein
VPWAPSSKTEELRGYWAPVTIVAAARALPVAERFGSHDLVVLHGQRKQEDAVRAAFPNARLVLC